MQERVLAFGGTLKIASVPGRGTEVRISLPLAQESALANFDAEQAGTDGSLGNLKSDEVDKWRGRDGVAGRLES
jgi:hypothetical protein